VAVLAAILLFAWQFFRKSEWDEMFKRGTLVGISLSPDRQLIASSSLGDGVRLWNASDRQVLARLGDAGFNSEMVFSPDGEFFAWAYSSYAQFYSTNYGRAVLSPLKARGPIWSMSIAPDSETIAVGSTAVELWNIVAGDAAHTLVEDFTGDGSYSLVSSLAFSEDGRLLAAGLSHGDLKVWELSPAASAPPVAFAPAAFHFTATQVLSTSTGTNAIRHLAFSQDGRSLAAGSSEGTVSLVSVPDGKVEALPSVPGALTTLAFSPDSSRLAVGYTDLNASSTSESGMGRKPSKIEVVPLKEGVQTWTSETGPEIALDVEFSPDGKKLTATYWDSSVRSYNLP
jgi:WD40 repeat protein